MSSSSRVTSSRSETLGSVSLDGRWISYLSDESGKQEAYVQSYRVPGGKYQVTTGGANWVGWTPDGKGLAYGRSSDPNHGVRAEVQAGSEFRLGPPRVFITFPSANRGVILSSLGERLLALLPAGKDPTPSITVVLDGLPGASGR